MTTLTSSATEKAEMGFDGGLLSLPKELLSYVCAFLPQDSLGSLARTCHEVRGYAEARLWRHLVLAPGDNDLTTRQWRPVTRRQTGAVGLSQRGIKSLSLLLSERPHIAKAVQRCTIQAADRYSNHLANVLGEIRNSVRHLSFTGYDCNESIGSVWMISSENLWGSMKPMPSLQCLELALPSSGWHDTLCSAIGASPYLSQLRLRPFPVSTEDWTESTQFGDSISERKIPSAKELRLLEIQGMSSAMEATIITLLQSSQVGPVKLVIRSHGLWRASDAFKEFVREQGDRLEVEMELPELDFEELAMYDEEDEAVLRVAQIAAWARITARHEKLGLEGTREESVLC